MSPYSVQCSMNTCESPATHYIVLVHPNGLKRLELCRQHLGMGHQLHDAKLAKICEYGRLDKAWAVHPGGMQ